MAMPIQSPRDAPERSRKLGGCTITVVGISRFGLSVACLLASAGFGVLVADADRRSVYMVSRGRTPFEEPGLEDELKRQLRTERISATTKIRDATSKGRVVVIATQIPVGEDGRPDYTPLDSACREVGMGLHPGTLVLVGVPVGIGVTETLIQGKLEEASGLKAGVDFGLAYTPPRVRIGRVLEDLSTRPWILGAIDQRSLEDAREILGAAARGGIIQVSSIRAAEAAGLFEMAHLNVDSALSNQLARLCEKVGVDFMEVYGAVEPGLPPPGLVESAVRDASRVLLDVAEEVKVNLGVVAAARRDDDAMARHVLRLVKEALKSCGKSVRRSRVTILGVSSTPNAKELKGSLALRVAASLRRARAQLSVYDPHYTRKELTSLGYHPERTAEDAIKNADCLLVAVAHNQFKELKPKRIRALMRTPAAVVDVPRILDGVAVTREGIAYYGLGWGRRA